MYSTVYTFTESLNRPSRYFENNQCGGLLNLTKRLFV